MIYAIILPIIAVLVTLLLGRTHAKAGVELEDL
jgi:cytochrome c oxidase subunit IV